MEGREREKFAAFYFSLARSRFAFLLGESSPES
jgi:hypothetical protein